MEKIKLGVSSCLLGKSVRFDGGHKLDHFLTDTLAQFFELVPVCPELEIGMGVPRESVRLEGTIDSPKMISGKSGKDWTDKMHQWSENRTEEFKTENLSGFIFKRKSPTCGLFRVPVRQSNNIPLYEGRGLFAAAFVKEFSLLPVEEEGRLHDADLRENFLERVFAYARVHSLLSKDWTRKDIIEFHSREKYLLMAHSPNHYKTLGNLVGNIASINKEAFHNQYLIGFMEALSVQAGIKRHVNTLQHIAGHLKKLLTKDQNQYIHRIIEDYSQALVPLIVPMTLLKHYIEILKVPYVEDQTYLNPHPKELMLRNHV